MILRSLAFALFTLLLSLATATAQTVTLSPIFGPQTKVVTVSGTGFGANQVVDVYFDLTQQCMTFANASGAFSCAVTVPANAQPGTHWISAIRRSNSTGAQKSFLVRTNWTQYRGRTAAHVGADRLETALDATTAEQIDLLWRVQLTTAPNLEGGNPVIYNGRLYVGTSDGKLHSRNAKTGANFSGWPKQTGGAGRAYSHNSPIVAGGRVYISGMDGKLHAFNAATGSAIAGFPFALTANSITYGTPPTFAGGKILLALQDTIFAVNVSGAPSLSWSEQQPGEYFHGAPTVLNETVYFARQAGISLIPRRLSDGAVPFIFLDFVGHIKTPAAANGRLHLQNYTTARLEVIRPDGALLYWFDTGQGDASPAIARGLIFTGSHEFTTVYAVRANDGSMAWSNVVDDLVFGLTWANDVIYVNTRSSLYAFQAKTGQPLARLTVPSSNLSNPVINDGIVYLMSSDGYLYAFAPNGSDPAKAPARGRPGAPSDRPPTLSSLVPDPQIAMTPAIAD